jgi:hypothetical protein
MSRAWRPPGPRTALSAKRAERWAAQVKRPASNWTSAFEGRLVNYRWGLAPTKKELSK